MKVTSYYCTGERLGRGITTDGITTPVVNTSAYWFSNSDELIDFKVSGYISSISWNLFYHFLGPL